MMSDCLSNLDKCKASCCKVLAFTLPGYLGRDLIDYYIKHGCNVKKISRDLTRILVPIVCPQLDPKTNLCKLHNTPDKPRLCVMQDAETMRSGRFYCTEGCIYGN